MGTVVYDKITREGIITRETESGLNMWEEQWTNKGKGTKTKAFFRHWEIDYEKKFPYSQSLQHW
jgi:hypothetical protein